MGFGQKIGDFCQEHSNGILTILSIGLTIGAVIETVRATAKSKDILDEAKYEKDQRGMEPTLTIKETLYLAAPNYLGAAALGLTAIGCQFVNYKVNNWRFEDYEKRLENLGSLYASATTGWQLYKNKVANLTSKTQYRAIEEDYQKAQIENDRKRIGNEEFERMIAHDPNTEVIYKCAYTGRYFKSTPQKLLKAIAKFNEYMRLYERVHFNDWCSFLGLEPVEIEQREFLLDKHGFMELSVINAPVDFTESLQYVAVVGLKNIEKSSEYFLAPINPNEHLFD